MLYYSLSALIRFLFFYFFNATATTEIYTLSLHDALPICRAVGNIWKNVVCRLSEGLSSPDDRNQPARSQGWPAACVQDRKSTRLNSSHMSISYAVFCLKKKI